MGWRGVGGREMGWRRVGGGSHYLKEGDRRATRLKLESMPCNKLKKLKGKMRLQNDRK